MIKRLCILSIFLLHLSSCEELQQVAQQLPQAGEGAVSNLDISNGLKEALRLGLNEGVTQLSSSDGYFKDELVKILLPEELRKVDKALRNIGLGSLADEGLKLMNRAAEDAVQEAGPIFANAITSMTFDDAKNILLGDQHAATNYLQNKTKQQLINAFSPKIQSSLDKVGANKIWGDIMGKYNSFTTNPVNTDLTGYVTEQAINGLFKKVELKEEGIRSNIGLRSTPLLQKVFALQD